jgi:DNA polymerase-1
MSKETKKKIVLLDAHAIIHRAYHALPDFTSANGTPTGAVYGFITMILKIIQDLKPDAVAACYDLPGPTFRHESFSDYKAGRSKTDDALKMQFEITREFCRVFGIPIFEVPGFEADDLLGTLALQFKQSPEVDVVIASGDMDTLQLVDENRVQVYTLKKGIKDTVMYNEDAVVERFKFGSDSIPDYKALRGDPSDNIPGIKGIGDKAATTAISHFGTIEKMYAQLTEEKGLEIGLTKRMVKLILEGKEEAEFSKILATIRTDADINYKDINMDGNWISSIDTDAVMEMLQKYDFRSLKNRFNDLGMEFKEDTRAPVAETVTDSEIHEAAIALWLIDSDKTKASEDDLREFTGALSTTQAVSELLAQLESDKENKNVFDYIEKPLIPIISEMQDNGIKTDVNFFTELSKNYHAQLDAIAEKIYSFSGEEFNIKSPKQLSHILFEVMELPTKGIKKSKTGSYSTNIDTLEKLMDEHEIIPLIVEYRELEKLVSTYIDVIPTMVADDGRLHAEFIQNGTTTGRFSSRNPNMQNIPTRTDLGRKIREGFVAEDGHTLLSFDYSQIELRCLALLSEDPVLTEIFKNGKDIHTSVAALIGEVPEDQVDRELRRKAKIVNFGILYGMGINALRKEMDVDRAEAQKFYDGFFNQFPHAASYLEATKQYARDHGYTKTLFGRKRQFKKINAKLPFIRAMAERMALNAPIQGTAADIIKLAMIRINQWVKDNTKKNQVKAILQIHDEIIYEVKNDIVEEFNAEVISILENILETSFLKLDSPIPLVVHSSEGKHWGELK